jgi:transposase
MQNIITHIGLDVHSASIEVAIAPGSGGGGGHASGEVRLFGRIVNREAAVVKLIKQLSRKGQSLCFWYEAGPTGYGLYRQLAAAGHDCHVVAPSLVPRKAGDRVKTDRRDAMMLARLGRAGELTSVWVPGLEQEAMRDLTRCREDAKSMQRIARQQLGAFLLRHGRHHDEGKKKWTKIFFHWLSEQKFESPVQQIVFQEYVNAVEQTSDRVEQLTRQLEELAPTWSLWPVVEGLCALRGVDLVTAATIMAELGDLTRFNSPRQLMAFLGLVPSEHSSGKSRRQGGITKTGNSHVRRVLVESSWCYRFPARMTKHLRSKAKPASAAVQAIAWKAQKRLCGRYQHLNNQGKLKVQTCVAVARELTGFIWAIAREVNGIDATKQAGPPPAAPSPAAKRARSVKRQPSAVRVTGSRRAESSGTL